MFDITAHIAVPDDWLVAIADIENSTAAIAEGRYKDVNTVTSCAIVAVRNAVGRDQVAYTHGGDGATFLLPPSLTLAVCSALYGVQKMAIESFGLTLRAGIVGVAELREKGSPVSVAKIMTGPVQQQAAISGPGIALAERLIKDRSLSAPYRLTMRFTEGELAATPPSFEGFECRWKPLGNRNGMNISLIVLANPARDQDTAALYGDVLQAILRICGRQEDWRPVSVQQLALSGNIGGTVAESGARAFGRGKIFRFLYQLKTLLLLHIATLCFRFGLKIGDFDGATFRTRTVENSDYIKFDSGLKMVMDISHRHKDDLVAYLEKLFHDGTLFYGLHESSSAMMTCLITDHDRNHFHFIDGSGGGYSLAAKSMKEQVKAALAGGQHAAATG
jgi:hypothetical protein